MTLYSSRSHREDVRDVERGVKPAALVDASAARHAEELGLIAEPVPTGTFTTLSARLAYVVYRPEDPDAAEKVLEVLAKYPMGKRGAEWHRELGTALGYPQADIDHFIRKFIG